MDTIQKILTLIKKSKGGIAADSLEKELGFSRQFVFNCCDSVIYVRYSTLKVAEFIQRLRYQPKGFLI